MMRTLSFITTHPLTADRPLGALMRFMDWQVRSRFRPEIVVDWIEGSRLLVKNGMTGATGNVYCGLHEFADMAFVMHLLRPDDLFIDVGANVGSYTVLASAVCGARTISVEPDPSALDALRRNVEINAIRGSVEVVDAVVGATEGIVNFTVGLDTVNHVVTDGNQATREIRQTTLDDIVGDRMPVLIKLDVEGYEEAVLAGASVTLNKASLLAVETESTAAAVLDQLGKAGFTRCHYEPWSRDLAHGASTTRSSSGNALFVRDLAACQQRLQKALKRTVLGQEL